MTDKEKLDAIRAEIHRLVDVRGYDKEMANDLFAFMDSLPNEPVSEDLEAEIERFDKTPESKSYKLTAHHFAQWQREQMMKDAVDACVTDIRTYKEENQVDFTMMYEKGIIQYEIEQEVKVIIIKED